MRVGSREINARQPPYIIAELGVNHDGSLRRALQLVEAARHAGADAIKLQWFETDRLLSRAARLAKYQTDAGARDPSEMLRALELNVQHLAEVVDLAHRLRLHAIVTLFSAELVEAVGNLGWDAYKTASPDVINRPLIEALMATEKPLFVSTGAATLDEIRDVSTWLGTYPHVLMQCVSAYPTPDESASLAGREAMAGINANALGYSDHTTAIDTGGLAVASGACALEKHLTYDRSAAGPDHAASLDLDGFKRYVQLAHRARQMLGDPIKRVLPIEQDVREASRQCLTTRRALPAGHVLCRDDLTIKRPGTGIEPSRLTETLGRRLAGPVEADVPLREADVQ